MDTTFPMVSMLTEAVDKTEICKLRKREQRRYIGLVIYIGKVVKKRVTNKSRYERSMEDHGDQVIFNVDGF